jgi:hypothetical protein
MQIEHARAIAERLHTGDREENGTPLVAHVRRVAAMVPEEAGAVAWLHEILEWTPVSEHELLGAGLTTDQLRALRLLLRVSDLHSDRSYLAHLRLIARAAGPSGRLARIVKVADLRDRCLHPNVRGDGWAPPYARALELLWDAQDDPQLAEASGAR